MSVQAQVLNLNFFVIGYQLDLPLVDLFLILALLILDLLILGYSSDEVARASARDVSRERLTCLTCRNVTQSVIFWCKNMVDISHFTCAPRAIVAKEESDFNESIDSRTQMNLFVYSAVCSQQY